ncbi:hypothetical protein HK098_002540 [Nowakowskiella sp. JEL0407]|nr:hypothetical protein HK098_002540 [Nowakowskiella sp. JEL0407]
MEKIQERMLNMNLKYFKSQNAVVMEQAQLSQEQREQLDFISANTKISTSVHNPTKISTSAHHETKRESEMQKEIMQSLSTLKSDIKSVQSEIRSEKISQLPQDILPPEHASKWSPLDDYFENKKKSNSYVKRVKVEPKYSHQPIVFTNLNRMVLELKRQIDSVANEGLLSLHFPFDLVNSILKENLALTEINKPTNIPTKTVKRPSNIPVPKHRKNIQPPPGRQLSPKKKHVSETLDMPSMVRRNDHNPASADPKVYITSVELAKSPPRPSPERPKSPLRPPQFYNVKLSHAPVFLRRTTTRPPHFSKTHQSNAAKLVDQFTISKSAPTSPKRQKQTIIKNDQGSIIKDIKHIPQTFDEAVQTLPITRHHSTQVTPEISVIERGQYSSLDIDALENGLQFSPTPPRKLTRERSVLANISMTQKDAGTQINAIQRDVGIQHSLKSRDVGAQYSPVQSQISQNEMKKSKETTVQTDPPRVDVAVQSEQQIKITTERPQSLETRLSAWMKREVLMRVITHPTLPASINTEPDIPEEVTKKVPSRELADKGTSTDSVMKPSSLEKSTYVNLEDDTRIMEDVADSILFEYLNSEITKTVTSTISNLTHEQKQKQLSDRQRELDLAEQDRLARLEFERKLKEAKERDLIIDHLNGLFEEKQKSLILESDAIKDENKKLEMEHSMLLDELSRLREKAEVDNDDLNRRFDLLKSEWEARMKEEVRLLEKCYETVVNAEGDSQMSVNLDPTPQHESKEVFEQLLSIYSSASLSPPPPPQQQPIPVDKREMLDFAAQVDISTSSTSKSSKKLLPDVPRKFKMSSDGSSGGYLTLSSLYSEGEVISDLLSEGEYVPGRFNISPHSSQSISTSSEHVVKEKGILPAHSFRQSLSDGELVTIGSSVQESFSLNEHDFVKD